MPVIAGGTTARRDYIYANPNTTNVSVATAAPGAASLAETQYASYTCPSGKLAIIEDAYVWAHNRSATDVNAAGEALLRFTPSGGAAGDVAIAIVDVALPKRDQVKYNRGKLMKPGDVIAIRARSSNTAATSDVRLGGSLSVTEFDA